MNIWKSYIAHISLGTWAGNEVTFERANILWEEEEEPRMPSVWSSQWEGSCFLVRGQQSGHIFKSSFRSYFIHNGRGRAEILGSEQIFRKSFVHRSRREASWENLVQLRGLKKFHFFCQVISLPFDYEVQSVMDLQNNSIIIGDNLCEVELEEIRKCWV